MVAVGEGELVGAAGELAEIRDGECGVGELCGRLSRVVTVSVALTSPTVFVF